MNLCIFTKVDCHGFLLPEPNNTHVSISDGRVLKYAAGEGAGWKTFAHSPSYTNNNCDASFRRPPRRAPAAGRLAFGSTTIPGPCKLMRYWIRGPKAGTSELFAELPGYPNNVRPDGKGGYWVALHREKYELPFGSGTHLVAIRVGANGEKLQEMRGPKGVRPTEAVGREDGKIYLGSVELSYVSIVKSN